VKIHSVSTFILHVPVTRASIVDSTHHVTHWGVPGVVIETDSGLRGYGYTGTHAHLPTDRLIVQCIEETYAPLLTNENPENVLALWQKLCHFPPAQWVGRCGITHLALSAVDIALWDIKAKAAGVPLWALLGGTPNKKIEAYNTDGGWLNWTIEELVADSVHHVEEEGYQGVKIKVGGHDLSRDLERIEAVRKAIGPRVKLMVDANGCLDLPSAIRFGHRLADYDVHWFEEPLWYDNVSGHATLARSISTPIALGEQLYTLDHFTSFVDAGAVHFVQVDAVRVAGVTEWWQVADLAQSHRLPVAPHIGDMMQVHLHLCIAHPACHLLEYIPWLRACFEEPATAKDGFFVLPEAPGVSTTLRAGALEKYGV
jgi:L-alanine-DL-glutamate epimerase-like enolase superfamily enzyme